MTLAEALENSIQHWRENARAETPREVSLSPYSCALCRLFLNEFCRGCPVMKRTGFSTCEESPYVEASMARDTWHYDPFDESLRAKFHAAANAEVAFLESLRPLVQSSEA